MEHNVPLLPETVRLEAASTVSGQSPAEAPARPELDEARVQVTERTPSGEIVLAETAEVARHLNAPAATAADDLQILQTLLTFFRKANQGENPVGGVNEEITDALRGKNAQRLAVIPPELPVTNSDGALLDRWGTPYFFHAERRDALEVRSAGPDRKMWTADDVVSE